jgi:hypothetical protein
MSYPSFVEAEQQLLQFLVTNQWPAEIVWIGPGDLYFWWGAFRVHPRSNSRQLAEGAYGKGVVRRLGVSLQGHCADRARSYCSVWVPADEFESQGALMPDGLKLSVALNPRRVVLVQGRASWWWQTRWGRPYQFV